MAGSDVVIVIVVCPAGGVVALTVLDFLLVGFKVLVRERVGATGAFFCVEDAAKAAFDASSESGSGLRF